MRKFYVFAVLALCVLAVAACSKKKDNATSYVVILAGGQEIESLTLDSGGSVQLSAILKDANGNTVEDYTAAWSSDAGSFSNRQSASTVFTARSLSYGNAFKLSVDCNGVTKTIPVTLVPFEVTWSYQGGNFINTPGSKDITVTAKRQGTPIETQIHWSLSEEARQFLTLSPETTNNGGTVTVTASQSLTGSFIIYATINGTEYKSMVINLN